MRAYPRGVQWTLTLLGQAVASVNTHAMRVCVCVSGCARAHACAIEVCVCLAGLPHARVCASYLCVCVSDLLRRVYVRARARACAYVRVFNIDF